MADSPYLNIREAMEYLRVPRTSSVYKLIYQQGLPYLRRGGRLLFDKRDIDAWLRGTDAVSLMRARKRSA